jgi:Universal stress protein family
LEDSADLLRIAQTSTASSGGMMTVTRSLPIVVGVSEETGSSAALRWAADESKRRAARVVAILVWEPPQAQIPASSIAPGVRPPDYSAIGAAAQHTLETHVMATLGSVHDVVCRAEQGRPDVVLGAESFDAQLLVLDSPRPGRTVKPRKGLLARKLIYTAGCPVVVIPPDEPARTATQKVKDAARSLASAAADAAAKATRPVLRHPSQDPTPDSQE